MPAATKKPKRVKSSGTGTTKYRKVTILLEEMGRYGLDFEQILADYGYDRELGRWVIENDDLDAETFNKEFAA